MTRESVCALLSPERRETFQRPQEMRFQGRELLQEGEGGRNERGGRSKNPQQGVTSESRSESRGQDVEERRAS